MKETSKASIRRFLEADDATYPLWHEVFRGKVLDVGPGDDPLSLEPWQGIEELTLFDKQDGDANHLTEYFDLEFFDCVHSSQCLEHLHDPIDALRQMLEITKPGGYVVATTPCFDLYEHGHLPSHFNGDHRSSWSLWRRTVPTNPHFPHIFVPDLPKYLHGNITARLCCDNYNWMDTESDQTLDYSKRVEAFIEIVIRKAE